MCVCVLVYAFDLGFLYNKDLWLEYTIKASKVQ